MKKWDKLNAEFSAVMDRLTEEDWLVWDRQKSDILEMRRKTLALKSKIQEEKLELLEKLKEWDKILNNWNTQKVELSHIKEINIPVEKSDFNQFAMAA